MNQSGIIDLIRNPFVVNDWINQGYGLTKHRSEQLANILFKTVDEISELLRNEGKYVAFVAIRWGFAEIIIGKLLPTKKWDNRQKYVDYGLDNPDWIFR